MSARNGRFGGRLASAVLRIHAEKRAEAGSTVDNLNNATALFGTAVSHDILGNRTQYGSTSYAWDALNRLTSLTATSVTTNYEYRADGMRTHKSSSSGYTEYYHDGQMPMEEAVFSGGSFTVTRYGIGARGMDYMEAGTASTRPTSYSNVGFPIYDAHGNMIATLARSGSSYAVNNQRSYDAGGVVRQGAATGDPKNRYCASLGHQQDDESGLVYMRARYYEPVSGRFVIEDPGKQGANLFVYASNSPISNIDANVRIYENVAEEITDILDWCVRIVNRFLDGDLINKMELIDELIANERRLRDISGEAESLGQELLTAGELDEEMAPYMGPVGAIQAKIGEL